MEGAYELRAPLKVDIKVGENWEEMSLSLQDPVGEEYRR
jgi:hypothetical protein